MGSHPKRGAGLKPWAPSAMEVLKRRVAALLARRLDVYEIVQMLSSFTMPGPPGADGAPTTIMNPSYTVNPRTGKPYGKTTIYRLRDQIYADWRRQDSEKVGEMFAEVVGSLQEVIRRGFASGDYEIVLGGLDRIINIIGANKPVQVDLNLLSRINWNSMSLEDIERIAQGEPIDPFLIEG